MPYLVVEPILISPSEFCEKMLQNGGLKIKRGQSQTCLMKVFLSHEFSSQNVNCFFKPWAGLVRSSQGRSFFEKVCPEFETLHFSTFLVDTVNSRTIGITSLLLNWISNQINKQKQYQMLPMQNRICQASTQSLRQQVLVTLFSTSHSCTRQARPSTVSSVQGAEKNFTRGPERTHKTYKDHG